MQSPYISNTDDDRKKMLGTIGVSSFEQLLEGIPKALRLNRPLDIPMLSEVELLKEIQEMSSRNREGLVCFAGGGVYDHFIPASVATIITRPEFMTAYTPYQPEVAQGTLQVIYEFQTHICRLTGMDVANASMYDGASAAAEAVIISTGATKRRKIVISEAVNPLYRQVISTYLQGRELEVVTVPLKDGVTDLSRLEDIVDEQTACVLVAQPNFFGLLEEVESIEKVIHQVGGKLIMAVDLISQAILKTPGEYGADFCVAEGQPLGIPVSFGGPLLGVFAAKKDMVRHMPGRIAARTKDLDGKTGFVLTLQTREQHIRREKATSNICTNQALCATAASVYLSLMGKSGLKKVALLFEMYRDHTYPEYLPDVSWQDEFTRNFSLDQNVNMSVSGGTKLVKYYGSLAYLHEGDILNIKERGQGYDPSFEFDRINFRSNLDFDITPTTRFSANLSGSHFIQKKPQGSKWSAWYTMYQMPPDVWPVKYSDGTWANRLSFASLTNGILEFNYNGYSLAKGTDVNTDFLIEQKLDFITKGLSASAKVSFDNRMRTIGPNVDGDPPVSKWISPDIVDALEPDMTEAEIRALENDPDYVVWNVTGAGSSGYDWVQLPDSYSNETAQTASVFRSLYYQFSLNYGRDFGKHSVTGLALVSRQESASGSAFTSYREDWVGRVTYDFDNRYLLELNAAYNGSEKFSNAYRFGFFPSMAFGWIASNEPFFGILKPYVNNLKFRYSDGKVGSDEGIARWLYTGSWIVYPINASTSVETLYRFGAPYIQNSYPFRYEGVIPNEDIHWETAHKRDLGIEAGFFDNLFLVTFDYFTENRTDIFLTGASRPVPSYYGANPVSANVGEVDVHGWEFEGKFARTTARGFNYWATFAWAYSKDKIIEGGDAPLLPAYQKKAGYQIDQPRVTLNQNEHSVLSSWNDVYNRVGGTTNTNLLPGDFARLDYNADGVIDSNDQVPYGYPARPQYTYSPAVGFGWKNLTAHLRFYGVYNIEGSTGQYTGAFSNSLSILYPWDLDQRWSPENGNLEGAESPHLRVSTTGTGGYVSTPRSYLRLEGAEISYVVDGDWVRKMGLSNFRLTLSGNNLFLWSKMYEDLDFNGPSTTDGRLTYPVLKRYTFGISLNFR